MLQSEERFYGFIVWKGEEDLREGDARFVLQEIVFLLGNEITEGEACPVNGFLFQTVDHVL